MSEWIELETSTGPVRAWRAAPAGPPRAGVVVLQEVFGVNAHVRQVAERFAAEGYAVLAPALFDPAERGVELGYDAAGLQRGRELRAQVGWDAAVAIIQAASERLAADGIRVGVVGFCWGGTLAFLANTRLGLPAVSYYGAQTVQFLAEPTRSPLLLHFGERDDSILPADIQKHRDSLPDALLHTYPAGHAFNRDVDPTHYDAPSASLAWSRTLRFFERALA